MTDPRRSSITRIEGFADALADVARRDPHVARAFALCGPPPEREQSVGFPGLLRAIVGQQVSAASARAIWGRLEAAVVPLEPAALLALDDTALRAIGLSGQKMRYARGLAAACVSGTLDLARLEHLTDDAAIAALVALDGIGRWTAEVYLLFAHGRADVFPADDLAIQVAAQRMLGLPERPTARALRDRAAAWQPYRGIMARFLWHYYRHPGVA